MSARPAYHPRRHLRHELTPLAILLASILAVVWVFPRAAVGFAPVRRAVSAPTCALVTLTEAEEDAMIAASRAAWRVDAADLRRTRLEIFAQTLPAASAGPVFRMESRARPAGPAVPGYRAPPIPVSVAAPPPEPLPKAAEGAAESAFPRRELLDAIGGVE